MLDHSLAREATYSKGLQTTTEAEKVYRKTLELDTVGGEIPRFTGVKAKQLMSQFNVKIKTSGTNATRSVIQEKLESHVKNLQVQGSLLSLASQEREDLMWKSAMFQLKSGTLKFLLNACIDTLPTPANLQMEDSLL